MLNRVAKILARGYVDDSCLGRQFAQMLSGYTNAQRGAALRTALAMAIDGGQKFDVEPSNFYGYSFRNNKSFAQSVSKPGTCTICGGLMHRLDALAERVAKQLKSYEYSSFLVGTRVSSELLSKEERLWEQVGIESTEPLRAELNREIGKRVEQLTGKSAELKKPDIAVLIDLHENKIRLTVNPLYLFGHYNKLVRGIPQAKWERYYPNSVEQIIAKPVMKMTHGKTHKLHAAGREDIDARCLAWRPFVLEILQPERRAVDMKKVMKEVNKTHKVQVKSLRYSDMETARKLKDAAPDKSYRALVVLDKPIKKAELAKLKDLVGTIHQQTPQRVLHRRAELTRKREVKSIKTKFINAKKFEMIIKGTAGLYIKELISSDNGRTKPSASDLLDRKAVCKELDVIKIGKII